MKSSRPGDGRCCNARRARGSDARRPSAAARWHPERGGLAPYLGLRTWFWRITVEETRQRLEWIVARVPRQDGNPEFRLVEERFDP